MIIIVKNKDTLLIDDFIFKCSIGKKGFCNEKVEGDLTTPKAVSYTHLTLPTKCSV